ncbi:hypothetical protein ACE1CM_33495, partial [Microseira sp. BLCC-F43]
MGKLLPQIPGASTFNGIGNLVRWYGRGNVDKQMVRVERVVTYPNSPSKPDVRLSPHRLLVCLALVMCTAFRCFRIRG